MICDILINHPGDGDWIMRHVGGVFNEKTDHSVAAHTPADGRIQGGVVFTGYLGASIMLHMAGNETAWASRDFLWMVFDYAFVQLGCRKLVGLVPAFNTRAVSIEVRLGFHVETRLKEMLTDPTEELLIFTMMREDCKWLRIVPKYYRRNTDDIRWVA
jgi:RimJ/RimL family protein N-acetyltransferase